MITVKTLVIHPDDRSTDFLKIIYEGKGYTIFKPKYNTPMIKSEMLKIINEHDRIMMMGHGSPRGLLGYSYIFMDKDFIKVLRTKNCVCIWCHADQYVNRFGIKGFYTGMFISEVGEARYNDINNVDQDDVDYSNYLFVELMRKMIESPNVLNEIKSSYVGDCPVIKFNNERLYYNKNNFPKYLYNLLNSVIDE